MTNGIKLAERKEACPALVLLLLLSKKKKKVVCVAKVAESRTGVSHYAREKSFLRDMHDFAKVFFFSLLLLALSQN